MLRLVSLPRSRWLLRTYATEIAVSPDVSRTPPKDTHELARKDGVIETNQPERTQDRTIGVRPTFRVEVNSNHGLYGFFRKYEDNGVVRYESLPLMGDKQQKFGRSWSAAELRRKSFRDLHTLWYVLLRERNLCATQLEEARRMGIDLNTPGDYVCKVNARKCRKSMARLKYVLNERRLVYEGALEIFAQKRAEMEPPQPTISQQKKRLREQLAVLLREDIQRDATDIRENTLKGQSVAEKRAIRKELYLRTVKKMRREEMDVKKQRRTSAYRAIKIWREQQLEDQATGSQPGAETVQVNGHSEVQQSTPDEEVEPQMAASASTKSDADEEGDARAPDGQVTSASGPRRRRKEAKKRKQATDGERSPTDLATSSLFGRSNKSDP